MLEIEIQACCPKALSLRRGGGSISINVINISSKRNGLIILGILKMSCFTNQNTKLRSMGPFCQVADKTKNVHEEFLFPKSSIY